MQQVLITGATGFIGRNLTTFLASRGYQVKALVRNATKASPALDQPNVRLVTGDITQRTTLDPAIEPGDVVIHLAARFNEPEATYDMYRQTNVEGTQNLMDAALARSAKRFIHCSTIGVAINCGPPPFDELSPYSPAADDFYETTKCEAEQLVLRYHQKNNLPAVVIRPVQPFGPGDTRKVKFYKLVKRGVVVGSGRARKHLVYIDDLTRAFELAIHTPLIEGEIFVVGGREIVTLKDMIQWAQEELHVRAPLRLPAGPLTLLTAVVESLCKPLRLKPPLYQSRLDFFTKSYFFDTRKAEARLGFTQAVPIRDGIVRTIAWYKEHNLL